VVVERIEEFCGLLRKNGVRVSTSEAIDAVRAVAAVGFEHGDQVRAALQAALIKRPADQGSFDELFSLFFLRGAALLDAAEPPPVLDMLGQAGLDAEQIAQLLDQLAGAAAGLGAVARTGLGASSPQIQQLVQTAGAAIDLERISSPLQVGYFSYRLLEELDIRGAEDAAWAVLESALRGIDADPSVYEALRQAVKDNLRQLANAVRAYVEQEFQRQNLDFMSDLAARSLSEKPLSQLSDADVDALRGEVNRLARVLRAKASLRHEVRKRGRLELRRTMRRSLGTGGVPFVLVRRERRRRKPRLVVLCDISDSVRNVSRFMLQLVYTLQSLFDRVYSFAFVAEIGELTDLFRRHDLDRAVALALEGAAVNVFANSNYGRSLEQFAERHMDKVTPRTTVIVIGDGRNNYHPSRASILGDIQRRAKQVWWLNPEAPAAWGFGDSAMREYEEHCDRVVVAYNLESLRTVVDELVM
jgi:uncharacterized protein with von Willebrand factor type A (vWA) domain